MSQYGECSLRMAQSNLREGVDVSYPFPNMAGDEFVRKLVGTNRYSIPMMRLIEQ